MSNMSLRYLAAFSLTSIGVGIGWFKSNIDNEAEIIRKTEASIKGIIILLVAYTVNENKVIEKFLSH